MSQKAIPLFENVLIKPLQAAKKSKSGILLPDNKDQNNIVEGEVIAVGSGDVLPTTVKGIGGMETLAKKPVVVKVGQHVVFKLYSATPLTIDGEKLLLVNQRDVLAIIDYGKTPSTS